MTFNEFHNALRILHSIDFPDFSEAIESTYQQDDSDYARRSAKEAWPTFMNNPPAWFIKARDSEAEAIWKIVETRNERHAG